MFSKRRTSGKREERLKRVKQEYEVLSSLTFSGFHFTSAISSPPHPRQSLVSIFATMNCKSNIIIVHIRQWRILVIQFSVNS